MHLAALYIYVDAGNIKLSARLSFRLSLVTFQAQNVCKVGSVAACGCGGVRW